jgi:membrane-associated PAP2 superfamily phosphatase
LLGLGIAQLYGAWRWGDGRWEGYALVVSGLASVMACSLVMRRDRRGVLLGYLVLLGMSGSAIVSLLKTDFTAPGMLWLLAAYGGARRLSQFDAAQQAIEEDARYRELFAESGEEEFTTERD